MFDNVVAPAKMRLAAIVCYHHRHYCTLVHHADRDMWTSLDDSNIKQVRRTAAFYIYRPKAAGAAQLPRLIIAWWEIPA